MVSFLGYGASDEQKDNCSCGWFGTNTGFMIIEVPVMVRGGAYCNGDGMSGLFAYWIGGNAKSYHSFRPSFVVE